MTSSMKALLRYGPLAAVTMVCAALAGLVCFRAVPELPGPVKQLSLVVVAAGMAIQGAALFPSKWESRLIIKPHPLAAGSLMLFAGAALLMVLMLTGCSPTPARPHARPIINFYGSESIGTWNMFGADVPSPITAQDRPRETQVITQPAFPEKRSSGFAVLRSQLCGLTPRWRVFAGRN